MDIKPTNILFDLTNNNQLTLIDFGYSIPESQPKYQGSTLHYSPPEVVFHLDSATDICRGSDMWSVGCVFYEWVCTLIVSYPLNQSYSSYNCFIITYYPLLPASWGTPISIQHGILPPFDAFPTKLWPLVNDSFIHSFFGSSFIHSLELSLITHDDILPT